MIKYVDFYKIVCKVNFYWGNQDVNKSFWLGKYFGLINVYPTGIVI